MFERKSKATTQVEQVLPQKGEGKFSGEPADVMNQQITQTKPETQKVQAESIAPGKSITKPEEKLAIQEKLSSSKSSPQPKKIGKFNVQIR